MTDDLFDIAHELEQKKLYRFCEAAFFPSARVTFMIKETISLTKST
jgi:hypothetical protein